MITLKEITAETLSEILKLKVAENQTQLVATNAQSIAQAHFEPNAWFRGIYAEQQPVGFVLLEEPPDEPLLYVWRLMIDGAYQGQGYGRDAMRLVVAQARALGKSRVVLSHQELPGNAGPFYRSLGFEPTGEIDEGETVLALSL